MPQEIIQLLYCSSFNAKGQSLPIAWWIILGDWYMLWISPLARVLHSHPWCELWVQFQISMPLTTLLMQSGFLFLYAVCLSIYFSIYHWVHDNERQFSSLSLLVLQNTFLSSITPQWISAEHRGNLSCTADNCLHFYVSQSQLASVADIQNELQMSGHSCASQEVNTNKLRSVKSVY